MTCPENVCLSKVHFASLSRLLQLQQELKLKANTMYAGIALFVAAVQHAHQFRVASYVCNVLVQGKRFGRSACLQATTKGFDLA